MEIPSFFVIVFTVAVSIWPESKLVEKGGRVLRFDTYTNCEKAMIAAVEKSLITKRFHVVNGNYGEKIVRVILPNGDKGTYECIQIDG